MIIGLLLRHPLGAESPIEFGECRLELLLLAVLGELIAAALEVFGWKLSVNHGFYR